MYACHHDNHEHEWTWVEYDPGSRHEPPSGGYRECELCGLIDNDYDQHDREEDAALYRAGL